MTVTRIWFENDAIQVDGLEAQAARSLYAVLDSDRVHVFTLSGWRLLQLRFDQYARKDGSVFASAADAKAYLDIEFGKTPAINVTWSTLPGKPSVFAPTPHTHLWADITDKPTSFPPSAHTHPWTDVTGKPATYPPSAHTHLWADITDRPTIPAATPLGTAAPKALGTATPGTSGNAAREDHVHPLPNGRMEFIGNLNVSETLLVALSVGMKRKTFALFGVQAGDLLVFAPAAAPSTGCEVVNVYPAGAGNVSVGYYTPALGIATAYSMPIAVYRVTQ